MYKGLHTHTHTHTQTNKTRQKKKRKKACNSQVAVMLNNITLSLHIHYITTVCFFKYSANILLGDFQDI